MIRKKTPEDHVTGAATPGNELRRYEDLVTNPEADTVPMGSDEEGPSFFFLYCCIFFATSPTSSKVFTVASCEEIYPG